MNWYRRLVEAEALVGELRHERDYWRQKAELLLDSTLFRRGDITNHVFSKPPVVDDPFQRVFTAMGKREIGTVERTD